MNNNDVRWAYHAFLHYGAKYAITDGLVWRMSCDRIHTDVIPDTVSHQLQELFFPYVVERR